MDGDVAVAIPGAPDLHGHFVPEDLLVAEAADRIGPDELPLDIIEHGIRRERRHPGFGIMSVACGDMVGDDLGQIVGDIGCRGDLLFMGVRAVLAPAPVSFRQERFSDPPAHRGECVGCARGLHVEPDNGPVVSTLRYDLCGRCGNPAAIRTTRTALALGP